MRDQCTIYVGPFQVGGDFNLDLRRWRSSICRSGHGLLHSIKCASRRQLASGCGLAVGAGIELERQIILGSRHGSFKLAGAIGGSGASTLGARVMKENGIGRPSTRANIIETLFRRKYIEKKKKNLIATETGMNLIDTIKSDLLKSPELTGQWERKLRLIEKGNYDPQLFKEELFKMVRELSDEVIFN